MTEKRYYAHKHLLEDNEVHDRICHNFMGLDETVEHMNTQYWKYKQLKKENEELKQKVNFYKYFQKDARELEKENEQLKQALLFFLDVANSECSSSFEKDMEHDYRKLFNCSYSEAKDKYGGYDATWWELGE